MKPDQTIGLLFGPITLTLTAPPDMFPQYVGSLGDLTVKLCQTFTGKWVGFLVLQAHKGFVKTSECSAPETAAAELLTRARALRTALDDLV